MNCAVRELKEETGLELLPEKTGSGTEEWWVYAAEAPPGIEIRLSDEHDRFEWLTLEEAVARCRPEKVGNQIRAVAHLIKP